MKKGLAVFLIAVAFILQAAFISRGLGQLFSDETQLQPVLIGQFTTGGCVHVCESLDMCVVWRSTNRMVIAA
ncbi:MAG: hypothetical protein K8F25_03795 [Fimbriimonadaceae bacterium]|nr:hypothetical protein [Alphaproteobacteria bacterium]